MFILLTNHKGLLSFNDRICLFYTFEYPKWVKSGFIFNHVKRAHKHITSDSFVSVRADDIGAHKIVWMQTKNDAVKIKFKRTKLSVLVDKIKKKNGRKATIQWQACLLPV